MNSFSRLMNSELRNECRRVAARLAAAGIPAAETEARLLLEAATGIPYFELEIRLSCRLSSAVRRRLDEWTSRRLRREPLQYILGRVFFRDLELEVTPSVLIPRPETELLVDWAVDRIGGRGGTLLDLGTGSGAIALSVAEERPAARVTAVDVSDSALAVARRNARRCGVEDKVEFLQSDLFSALEAERRFDVICANLPYVTEEEFPTLEPEVRDHEPRLALVAPDAGLSLILRAAAELPRRLNADGAAIFELSPFQAPVLAARFEASGFRAAVRRDLTGRDRFVTAERMR